MDSNPIHHDLDFREGRRSGAARQAPPPDGAARESELPSGGFTSIDGEEYYRISHSDRLRPFLMNIASDADLWMFLTSRGGLTTGRMDAEGALFPYEPVDRLLDSHHHTGPITLLRVRRGEGEVVAWAPLQGELDRKDLVERRLYKNLVGNRVIFEEEHHQLELTFRYQWSSSDAFGLVRTVELRNDGDGPVGIWLLDGLRNVLPYGAPLALQRQASSLVDAYKRVDLAPEDGLAIFSLTSRIADRAEASEALRANVVWSRGLEHFDVCLSSDAIAAFRRGETPAGERLLTGQRGSFLVVSSLTLAPHSRAKWCVVADIGCDHLALGALRARIRAGGDLVGAIELSLDEARENLLRNVGSADGLQVTGDPRTSAHHLANVLFNNMRGGVFARNYVLPTGDLADFLSMRNTQVAERRRSLLESLPKEIAVPDLLECAERSGDPDLIRLAYEYLPVHFSRRHGDPSRPWNQFEIRLRNEDGSPALHYEGNWRDLFQNWDALAQSFPGFLPGMIAKFVNASTVDGFNPYRVTRDGFEWEVPDPSHPWSHIGYWGDHQVVYLQRFLESLNRYSPGALEALLDQEIFTYAEVPYRLRPYAMILQDPHATIDYDLDLAARIEERVRQTGTDGRLVHDRDSSIYHVNLAEKLLVPALSKLSNFVPGGGIWMNTQRPEWNDANNALVGRGLSVVTLCYLRQYIGLLEHLFAGRRESSTLLSAEVARWLADVRETLVGRRSLLGLTNISPRDRKQTLDALGESFSRYRIAVYANGFSARVESPVSEILELCGVAREFLDHSIRENRREDGLFHSYNLLELSSDGREVTIERLPEMLEGQVAALASGVVEGEDAVRLVSLLFQSRLFREDQRSFLLYPERTLPSFLERNVIPAERIAAAPLLEDLLAAGDRSILARDADGLFRFHADLSNARDLTFALDRLASKDRWRKCVARDRDEVLALFDEVFRHRSFTGRSGAMYGYEGLGCIYWHMVAKLLLAVQEVAVRAEREGQSAAVARELAHAYYRIRGGLGFEKSVAEYGAFPTDPYSHTPRHAGAQQPGMTGQVKEEILTRLGELGLRVENGALAFRPSLLRRAEFRMRAGTLRYEDLAGSARSVEVPAGSLAYTFCQVPVIYELLHGSPGEARIRVTMADGGAIPLLGDSLDARLSEAIFWRRGLVSRIDVGIPEASLLRGEDA